MPPTGVTNPALVLAPGAHGHEFVAPEFQRHCLTPASELWDKLRQDEGGRARKALEELTRALAAAAAGEHGILAIEYDS